MRNLINRTLLLSIYLFILLTSNLSHATTVDIRDFGAVGNGIVNATEAISDAINTLQDNDVLLIPNGIYLVDQLTIIGVSDLTITGGGTLLASTNGRGYFIIIKDSPGIHIDNIVIDGNQNKNIGLDIYTSPGGLIEDLNLKNIQGKDGNWSAGIRFREGNSNFTIADSKIEFVSSNDARPAVGIWVLTHGSELYNTNMLIENTEVSHINSLDDADGIKIQQQDKDSFIEIKNCYFLNTRKRAIKLQTNQVKISNNIVERTQDYGNGFSAFSAYGGDIQVSNNRFESFGNASVNMFIDVASVRNVIIVYNTHINSPESTASVKDFLLTKYHVIDNSFTTKNLYVRNNTITNVRSFMRIRSSISNASLLENIVQDLKSYYIHIVNDAQVINVQLVDKYNSIDYYDRVYDEVYIPNRSDLEVIVN